MTYLPPGRKLDKLVAEAIGNLGYGNLGQHNWEWNEYSEYNQYMCTKCNKSSKDWANKDELPLEGCYKNAPMYSTTWFYTEELIRKFRLVIRPSVLRNKWVAGKFERVHLDGKVEVSSEMTGKTIPHAIALVVVEIAKMKAK